MPSSLQLPSEGRIKKAAKDYGCPNLLFLSGAPTAKHLDYLDLLPKKASPIILPQAVAEYQGRPLLYLHDGLDEQGQPSDRQKIQELQGLLANRSEHACLGVVRPGSLEIYPINLDRQSLANSPPQIIQVTAPGAPTFFQSLASGVFELQGQPKQADYVFHEIHRLLSRASSALRDKMEPLDILSVTGRALFFRFLIDRRIVLIDELADVCGVASDLKDVFSDAQKAAATSCWLDKTFNGDLLPLVDGLTSETDPEDRKKAYLNFYRKIGNATGQNVFNHLQAILRGWKQVGVKSFQLTLDWDDLDFAHIPIGVLSQVYETFSRQWDKEHAEETSVYYTPKNIARLLVDEAFAGLDNPEQAKILDPACGAGVFLVLAFHTLIRLRWEKDGKRPDTRAIQKILYKQIRGFDASESALRLAALALYISAIEVNGAPRPPESLKFPSPLRNQVLFNFAKKEKNNELNFELGSLGPHVPSDFNGTFDIVVANPPWTRLRASDDDPKTKAEKQKLAEKINIEFTAITRRALTSRNLTVIADTYSNPDKNPDLPFLWRATEWAKPNGIIAMALPGRIILRQSDMGVAARNAILQGLEITGIINGSDLEETAVWPNMKLPFLLLFAKNRIPKSDHYFHFATPIRENRLSSRGQFRLDYTAAESVSIQALIKKPWLLKSLAVGTTLDIEVIDKLPSTSIGELWSRKNMVHGSGYHISADLKQKPANELLCLLDFEPPESGFAIEYSNLKSWHQHHNRSEAHAPREAPLYAAPLLIVPQAPGETRDRPKSYISRREAVAFSQSYYGYSAAAHPEGELLVSLLHLITHSLLYQHFCLMRSSRQGASFRTILMEDIDAFPFSDPVAFTVAQKRRIVALSKTLETKAVKPWEEIDSFVFQLYGLDEDDATVVRDTVTFSGPYKSVREPAELPATPADLGTFCKYLRTMIEPVFEIAGQRIVVDALPLLAGQWNSPWRFVSIHYADDNLPEFRKFLFKLMEQANRTAASRIIVRIPGGGLLLGLLNQRRFWTKSRARLCALHIQHKHLGAFPFH